MDHVPSTVSGSWVERGIIIVHMNESCVVAYLGRIRSAAKLIASKWQQHDSKKSFEESSGYPSSTYRQRVSGSMSRVDISNETQLHTLLHRAPGLNFLPTHQHLPTSNL